MNKEQDFVREVHNFFLIFVDIYKVEGVGWRFLWRKCNEPLCFSCTKIILSNNEKKWNYGKQGQYETTNEGNKRLSFLECAFPWWQLECTVRIKDQVHSTFDFIQSASIFSKISKSIMNSAQSKRTQTANTLNLPVKLQPIALHTFNILQILFKRSTLEIFPHSTICFTFLNWVYKVFTPRVSTKYLPANQPTRETASYENLNSAKAPELFELLSQHRECEIFCVICSVASPPYHRANNFKNTLVALPAVKCWAQTFRKNNSKSLPNNFHGAIETLGCLNYTSTSSHLSEVCKVPRNEILSNRWNSLKFL